MGLDMELRLGQCLGSQVRLQIVVPAIYLTPVAMIVIVRLIDCDNGSRCLAVLMVAFGRRHSISAAAAVAVLLLVAVVVAVGVPDILQDMVSVEILLVVAVAAVVGHHWFQLRSRQSF